MNLSLLPCSSTKLSAPCPLRRSGFSTSSSPPPFARLLGSSPILPTIKVQRSNVRPYGHIDKLKAIPIQDPGQDESNRFDTEIKKRGGFIYVLWRFTRPFILLGACVSYVSILARAWMENPHALGWSQLLKALGCLVAIMASASYNAAVNQLFDLEIDRINKPDLPIASGDLSIEMSWLLAVTYAAIGITIAGVLNYRPYTYALLGVYLLGTLYSVPPFSMKKSFLGAFVINTLMGGCVGTLISTSAASATLGLPFGLSFPVLFLLIFATTNCAAIAILKDLSDVEGDRKYNVPTIPVAIGVRNAALIAFGILLLNYIGAILTPIFMPQVFRRSVMIPAFTILALCLIFQIWKLIRANYKKEASYNFYQFQYKLLFLVYVIFPFN